MTSKQALKMAKAKLECIERQTSGKAELCNNDCESCSLCYEQGNMGEQKEWLKMAIKALEQEPILDKIREDVNKLFVPLCDGSEEWRSYVNETLLDVLEIINKYKSESEVKE